MKKIFFRIAIYAGIFAFVVFMVNLLTEPIEREDGETIVKKARYTEAESFSIKESAINENFGNLKIKSNDIIEYSDKERKGDIVFTGEIMLTGIVHIHEATMESKPRITFSPDQDSLKRIPQEQGQDEVSEFTIFNNDLFMELHDAKSGDAVEIFVTEVRYQYNEYGMTPYVTMVPINMEESMNIVKDKANQK